MLLIYLAKYYADYIITQDQNGLAVGKQLLS